MDTQDLRVGRFVISRDLFEQGYRAGGGPGKCTATCCSGGVYTDIAERSRILAHEEIIRKHMDDSQTPDASRWFEDAELDDDDFPSGKCVGTRVVNGKCVFLDRQARCTLQVAATEEGMHRWALKPLFCILFPIEISDGRVSFDPLLQGDEECCSVTTAFDVPLFEACREELTHLLGKDGFRALRTHYTAVRGNATVCERVTEE